MGGIVMAFKRVDLSRGLYGGDWIGLKNFLDFFKSWNFWRLIQNTITISFSFLVLAFPFPIILAICLNEVRSQKFKKTAQMITYAPYFISVVVVVGILWQLLSPYGGIVNNILGLFDVSPVNFMGVPRYFVPIYVISGVWQGMGYVSIIFIAALTSIELDLYEAAKIDGVTKLQKIMYIDIPSLLPTIVIMFILNMGSVMNVSFEKIFLMQNELNRTVSEVISIYVYEQGILRSQFGFGTAISLFNSVINLALVFLFNTIGRKVSGSSVW